MSAGPRPHDWVEWRRAAPPKETWVWARYEGDADVLRVKTCRRGCCVWPGHSGNMMLPDEWAPCDDQSEPPTTSESDNG